MIRQIMALQAPKEVKARYVPSACGLAGAQGADMRRKYTPPLTIALAACARLDRDMLPQKLQQDWRIWQDQSTIAPGEARR